MRFRAMAKINLALDVLGKRPDGYHDVRMIMQTISMYDTLTIEKKPEPGISLSVNLPFVPTDERNLVYRAAKLLMDEFRVEEGVRMNLAKFIPVAAGMAGGSSDAAAALVGVNRIFSLGLSTQELMERGLTIGADVPYCVMRGTALAEGIGEKLTRLPDAPDCFVLIGKPGISVSTRQAYESLDLSSLGERPDIDGMMRSIEAGDLYGMADRMCNVFEPGISGRFPVIRSIRDLMEENGALKAVMSGSGPTVFGIFDDREKMKKAADVLKHSGMAKTVYGTALFRPGRKEGHQ
ncbi:MAG: 4-(cytidine 5'-diphospho)-2-C-methyl-D-erythritol kinase [Blautia sp.]|nr:4-(cytidine 5'-diphospho)-2-C-methyl-D-erythritol kinase [Blautia sp.]